MPWLCMIVRNAAPAAISAVGRALTSTLHHHYLEETPFKLVKHSVTGNDLICRS